MSAYGLDFNTLYGSGAGNVEQSQDVMRQLFDLLKNSQREEFQDFNFSDFGELGQTDEYGIQGWEDWLGGSTFTSSGTAIDEDKKKMASTLLSLLQGSGLEDLSKGYRQDVGDISSEFGAQLQGLQKGYSSKGKGGRYSKMGTGGRNIASGGRSKYMSDIYGLQQKQQEMQQGLQDRFSDDFYDNIARWQGTNPAPYRLRKTDDPDGN